RRTVRGVHAAAVRHPDRADVSARGDSRRERAGYGCEHPDADRLRLANRAPGEEPDPVRRVSAPERGAGRPVALRRGDRRRAHAPASDPDDVVRVHSRRAAARNRRRAGQGDAPGPRHRRVLRHARRDAVRSDLHAGLLRRLPEDRARAEGGDVSGARFGAIAAAFACVAGCAVGPDYRAPEPASVASAPFAGADVDAFAQDAPPADWWRLYDDPALDAAIAEAFDANTD